jgi:hypothetical protein
MPPALPSWRRASALPQILHSGFGPDRLRRARSRPLVRTAEGPDHLSGAIQGAALIVCFA